MADFAKMTLQEQLDEVNRAIASVLWGGQSYSIGSRSMTRADLSLLKSMRDDLEAQVATGANTGLMDNTFVAVFEGR
jgi:hypothetical protein